MNPVEKAYSDFIKKYARGKKDTGYIDDGEEIEDEFTIDAYFEEGVWDDERGHFHNSGETDKHYVFSSFKDFLAAAVPFILKGDFVDISDRESFNPEACDLEQFEWILRLASIGFDPVWINYVDSDDYTYKNFLKYFRACIVEDDPPISVIMKLPDILDGEESRYMTFSLSNE